MSLLGLKYRTTHYYQFIFHGNYSKKLIVFKSWGSCFVASVFFLSQELPQIENSCLKKEKSIKA